MRTSNKLKIVLNGNHVRNPFSNLKCSQNEDFFIQSFEPFDRKVLFFNKT